MRKNGEWVLDDDTIYWFNSSVWNGKEGEDETIDPKVVEEWIKEADRKQGVLKDEQY